jgi:NADH-quinone oxidoreductase subunit M
MILAWLIAIPFIGGLLAWVAGIRSFRLSRWLALVAMAVQFVFVLQIWLQHWGTTDLARQGPWLVGTLTPWIPQLGISIHFALDGISLLLLLLTSVLGMLAVIASWHGIHYRVGYFHFILLWTLAAISGVLLSLDLFLFYFFWEMMLIPLYFLIDIWGHEHRHYAAVKFFIFTQVGGLFLLLGILGLFFLHGDATGRYTFDYFQLLGTPLRHHPVIAFWLMLAFFLAFAVKLPTVPLHSWLPDAHTQAPVAGSVDLAGLVLKVGAYGLLRFVIPLFPQAALAFAPVAMTLAVISIIYGALLAFAQKDLKRLVAYTSISHMGFVMLGIFAWNQLSLQGVAMLLVSHGVSTGATFILVGSISQRLKSRNMDQMGGLWAVMPQAGGFMTFWALALLGLPGLGNFIGEFLVLLGTFRVSALFASIAAVGFILSVIYALWMVYKVFYGPLKELSKPLADPRKNNDLSPLETGMMLATVAITLWLGLYPQTLLNTTSAAVAGVQLNATGVNTEQMHPVGSHIPGARAGQRGTP